MNILIFSWRDPKHPLAGGAEQVMHEHFKGWIGNGYQVTLFSSSFDGALQNEVIDGVRIYRRGSQLLGVHVHAFFWYLFSTEKFDLVVDQFHGIPFFTPLYVRAPKLAVLQEVAREVWMLNDLPKPINWVVGLLGYYLEPFIFWIYKNIDFITGSESAKTDLISFGISAKRISVVPHGVIIKKTKKVYKKDKRQTLIFLGALAKDKGIEDALKAFEILNTKQKFQFWVVGKGEESYVNYLKHLCGKYHISNNVTFFGFVSPSKKLELLSRSHLLINPSVREGWGLVNIEANAMGTPIISYKSPGLVDSVKENVSGLFCMSNSPQDIADKIMEALQDKSRYAKLSSSAKKWARQFDWTTSRMMSIRIVEKIGNR